VVGVVGVVWTGSGSGRRAWGRFSPAYKQQ